jgi:hypothetical protein
MAYATTDDVEVLLPEGEEMPSDTDQLEVMLESATDLVIAYLHREYAVEDVPDAVRRTVARVALRAFLADPSQPGAESEVNLMGPFSHTVNWSKEAQARDLYLTTSDEAILDRFITAYNSGVAHFPMYGDPCATQ